MRPPGDAFSFNLYADLVGNLNVPAIYIWSGAMAMDFEKARVAIDEILNTVEEDIVFVCIRDHFSIGEFNFTVETKTSMSKLLGNWAVAHPRKTILLFTALEELARELGDVPNIKIVRMGGDITNHQKEYLTLEPVLDKNLNSTKCFVCLNRNARFHRVSMVSMLYAMNLAQSGIITFLDYKFFRHNGYLDHIDWNFSSDHEEVKQLFVDGFPTIKDAYNHEHTTYADVYSALPNDNVDNFNRNLRKIYRNSFIEIISETTVTEPSFLLTEKTLNSIYGCNFPILISGQGSVKLLREMGMDVFDDIVDHSYDDISDPLLRMHQAITDNLNLLSDVEMVKDLWRKNQHRFINNVAFAKGQLYTYYSNRAKKDFYQAIKDIDK